MGGETRPERGGWEAFVEMERQRLQQQASGKMREALGHALPGESQEDLDRIAALDQRLAQRGLVRLKTDEGSQHKYIDEITREDRKARIAAATA